MDKSPVVTKSSMIGSSVRATAMTTRIPPNIRNHQPYFGWLCPIVSLYPRYFHGAIGTLEIRQKYLYLMAFMSMSHSYTNNEHEDVLKHHKTTHAYQYTIHIYISLISISPIHILLPIMGSNHPSSAPPLPPPSPAGVRHWRWSVIELGAALVVEPRDHVVRLAAAVVIDLDQNTGTPRC